MKCSMNFFCSLVEMLRSRWAIRLALLVPALFGSRAVQAAPQPNIVFILADDMGYGDVSKYYCTDYVTTNIDRIANEGVMLTQAYAWPVCSPSRAALLTGMDPKRAGVPAVLMSGAAGINTNTYTIAEHLKRNGYATGAIGKWHLGYTGNALPQARGFDTFFGFHGGEVNYTNFWYTSGAEYDLWDGGVNVAADYQGQYATQLWTEKAKAFINAHTNQPFFLYLAYNAPHYPLYAPTNYTAMYTGIPYGNRRTFAAMVRVMDDGIGEILNLLAAKGLSSNTIVWFMTDNGPMTGQGGVALPLKGEKYVVTEGGIRLPSVVKWPGHIPAGTTSDVPFRISDVYPTLCAAVGESVPSSLRLDGTNMIDVLTGNSFAASRTLAFFDDGAYAQRAVVDGDWKMINTNGTAEVYNLASDLSETTDLSGSQSARIAEMEQAASDQWSSIALGLYNTNKPPEIMKFRGPRL